MTDQQIEYEVRIAACAPSRFFDIADRFYRNTKADHTDKVLWRRFFTCCKRILVDAGEDGPYTMMIATPDPPPRPVVVVDGHGTKWEVKE